MPQPEPPPTDSGSDELISSGSTVEVGGSENITVTDARAGRDLSITQTILQAPKPKPTLPAETPHNLPERTTSAERFVGRSQELEQIKRLLAPEGSRSYLTGMGGMGKSELAIQHAYNHLEHYSGGIVRLDARQGQMQKAMISRDHETLQRLLKGQGCQAPHGVLDGVELALHVGADIGEVVVDIAFTGVVDADAGDHQGAVAGQFLDQHGLLAADQIH